MAIGALNSKNMPTPMNGGSLSPYRKKVHKLCPIDGQPCPSYGSHDGIGEPASTFGSEPLPPPTKRLEKGSPRGFHGAVPQPIPPRIEHNFRNSFQHARGVHSGSLRGYLAAAWAQRAELQVEYTTVHRSYAWFHMATKLIDRNVSVVENFLFSSIFKLNKQKLRQLKDQHADDLKSEQDASAAKTKNLKDQHATMTDNLEARHKEDKDNLKAAHREKVARLNESHSAEIENIQTAKANELEALTEAHLNEMNSKLQEHQASIDEHNAKHEHQEKVIEKLKEDHAAELLAMDNRCQAVDGAGKEEAARLRSDANKADLQAKQRYQELQEKTREEFEDARNKHNMELKKKEQEIEMLKKTHDQEVQALRTQHAKVLEDSLQDTESGHQAAFASLQSDLDAAVSERKKADEENKKLAEQLRMFKEKSERFEAELEVFAEKDTDQEHKLREDLHASQKQNEELFERCQDAEEEIAELRKLQAAGQTEGVVNQQAIEELQRKHEREIEEMKKQMAIKIKNEKSELDEYAKDLEKRELELGRQGRDLEEIPKPPGVRMELEEIVQLSGNPGCGYWDVTLTKAHESDKFGFSMDYSPGAFLVRRVDLGGLLDRWNQLHPKAQVETGDRIVCINHVASAHQMQQMLQSPSIKLRVARYPSSFDIVLSKQEGAPLGFRFERPKNNSSGEIRITEVLDRGCVVDHNAAQIAAGCWDKVVLADMRIQSVNGVSQDAVQMAEELRSSAKVKLALHRSDAAYVAKQKVKVGVTGVSAMKAFQGLSASTS